MPIARTEQTKNKTSLNTWVFENQNIVACTGVVSIGAFLANIDDVRRKRMYTWNILHWSKNDFKSNKSTKGDCSC